MATYWIDPVSGNDGNTGLGFGQAKLTWKNGIDTAVAAGVGNTVNVVNTGVVTVPSVDVITVTTTGTSYTNFGLKVQGADATVAAATGTYAPAVTEVRFQDNASTQSLLDAGTNAAFIILQGFHVNWSANATAATTKRVVRRTVTTANNIRIQYCYFHGKSTVGGHIFQDTLATPTTMGVEMRYNYVFDFHTQAVKVALSAAGKGAVHHNVFVVNTGGGTAQQLIDCGNADGPNTDHQFYNNTIVVKAAATGSILLPWNSDDPNGASSGTAIKRCNNNIYANYLAGVSDVYRYCEGPGGTPSSASYSRTFGNSVFYLPGGKSYQSVANGPYWRPWDEDDVDGSGEPDYWTSDVVSSSVEPFNASGSSWPWTNINGDGYTLTLVGDYRVPIASGYRTVGSGGTVPGAIEQGLAVAVDDTYSAFNDEVLDVAAPGVLSNDTDTGGTTAVLVSNVSPSAGVVALASDGSFTYTPAVGFTGAAVFTYKLDTGGGAFSNTATVTITVTAAVSPAFPTAFSFPDGTKAAVIIDRNTVLHVHEEFRGVQEAFDEIDGGTVELATNVAAQTLPLAFRDRLLMAENDQPVVVQVNSQTLLLLQGGCLLIDGGSFVTFKATNPSTVKAATIRYLGAR